MVKYSKNTSTGNKGISHVNSVVTSYDCICIETPGSGDIGIDCFIEFIENEHPLNTVVAVQVKTGKTYYKDEYSRIPINNHYDYWKHYPLPVFGVVVMPHLKSAKETGYWVDIKKFLKQNPDAKEIQFENTILNKFDRVGFRKFFVPYVLRCTPELTFAEATKFLLTKEYKKIEIAVTVLLNKYHNNRETWDLLLNYFLENSVSNIPGNLVYALSFIPWHPDLYSRFTITEEIRDYAKAKIRRFGKEEITKLFSFVDEENLICRGSLGQCVEAIIELIPLPSVNQYLEEILLDFNTNAHYKNVASVIYAYYNEKASLSVLKKVQDNPFTSEIITYVEQFGFLNPYA